MAEQAEAPLPTCPATLASGDERALSVDGKALLLRIGNDGVLGVVQGLLKGDLALHSRGELVLQLSEDVIREWTPLERGIDQLRGLREHLVHHLTTIEGNACVERGGAQFLRL